MNVANILTFIRLILTPVFIVAFIMGQHAWAILLFSVAGFTDLIDGTVARLLKQHSEKGALLDPMADKFLMQSCFICLFAVGIIPWWFFLLALGRDLMIVTGIFYLEYRRAPLPYQAVITSKIATVFQLGVAVAGLMMRWQPTLQAGRLSLNDFFFGLLLTTTFLLIVSGTQYVFIGLRILKQHRLKGEITPSS
jgi:cardiolipin synthase